MSRISGEQRRGCLDQYRHTHASTVNNATVWYDEDTKSFVANDVVAKAAPTTMAAPAAADDDDEGGSAEEGTRAAAAPAEQWIPNYRGDGNEGVESPEVSVPLRIHASAWQEPWKRVQRPVRATEAELVTNAAFIEQE